VTDEDGNAIPFVEVIDPRAFERTLRETRDIKALINHDTAKVLGSTAARTLDLTTDSIGLAFRDDIPDVSYARDAKVLVARGDVSGCSFRFYTRKDRIEERAGLPALRTLLDIDIDEISLAVTFPAYLGTEVHVRAQEKAKEKAAPSSPVARHAFERRRLELLSL
jgi:HK97 family phage prohead protease